MEAQERSEQLLYGFQVNVLWSVIERDGLKDLPGPRGHALANLARDRVNEYLRFHPFPEYCCNPYTFTMLEIA